MTAIKSEVRLGLGSLAAVYIMFLLSHSQGSGVPIQVPAVLFPFAFIAVTSGILSMLVKYFLERSGSTMCD